MARPVAASLATTDLAARNAITDVNVVRLEPTSSMRRRAIRLVNCSTTTAPTARATNSTAALAMYQVTMSVNMTPLSTDGGFGTIR